MDSERKAHRADRVAATGALTALVASLLLPFVSLRDNRLVEGTPHGIAVAGPLGGLLVALAVCCLAAALLPPERRRPIYLRLPAAAMPAALAWALGKATTSLLAGAPPFARVSLSSGAWLTLLGTSVVLFAAARSGSVGAGVRAAIDAAAAAVVAAAFVWGGLTDTGIGREYAVQAASFWQRVVQHLGLSGISLGLGIAIGVPLGVLAARNPIAKRVTLGVVGVIQTIPSLALLGLLLAPLAALRAASPFASGLGVSGIGPYPAVIALTLYALLPIVRNTYVGLSEVDPAIVDAGRGMGMSRAELLGRVEFPLALPLVLEGVRASAVLVIGIAAVTAFIGAGGLGVLIFTGLGQQAEDLVLLGALPVVIIAVSADLLARGVGTLVVSPGIRGVAR